jgi:hypothetical protein
VFLLAGVLLAGSGWQASAARADDSIVLAPPSSQPVADQITQIRIGVSVDNTFPGGVVEVTTKISGNCGQTSSDDSGTPAPFLHGDKVGRGPLTLSPQKSGLVALLTLRQGQNVICAWPVSNNGIVETGAAVVVIARHGTLLRGWNQRTVACRSLTRSEAAQALQEPASKLIIHGGP